MLSSEFTAGGRLREPPASRCKMEMKTPPPNFAGLGVGRVEPGEGGEGRVLQVRAGEGRAETPAPDPGRSPGAPACSARGSRRGSVSARREPDHPPEELVLLLQVVVPALAALAAVLVTCEVGRGSLDAALKAEKPRWADFLQETALASLFSCRCFK